MTTVKTFPLLARPQFDLKIELSFLPAAHERRWRRHQRNHEALKAALQVMGLGIASQAGHKLWQLNAITVPEGVDEAAVRKRLLTDHSIEVGAGLGPLKGKIWRVGLMGETSSLDNVKKFLGAFGGILNDAGFKVDARAALAAAEAHKL